MSMAATGAVIMTVIDSIAFRVSAGIAASSGPQRMVENGAFTWQAPFWEQPMHRWTSMMVPLRSRT
jgi:hypothetical protein